MLRLLFAALLLVPLADAFLLVVVASHIGAVPTVALVVLTALLGMLFVRAEGRHTLQKMQRSAARGDIPTNEVVDGGMLIAAGAFLLTPGLVTDAIGFLFALPVTRIPIRMGLKRFVIVPLLERQTGGFATGKVYTFGFPGGDDSGWSTGGMQHSGGPGPGPGRGPGPGTGGGTGDTSGSDDTVDLGSDAYEVEFEDDSK
ncbi:MAG: FxsA family protein [Halanaeroarchaeum sp.]